LPRFCHFVGAGWADDVMLDNHVDTLSARQIERLFRQVKDFIYASTIINK
jgi:hypothetical protein